MKISFVSLSLLLSVIYIVNNLTASDFSEEQNKVLAAKKEEFLKKSGIKTMSELSEFIPKFKLIKINEDSESEVITRLGIPSTKNVLFGTKVWRYTFLGDNSDSVTCSIEFDSNQKVAYADVVNSSMSGMENALFSRSLSARPESCGSKPTPRRGNSSSRYRPGGTYGRSNLLQYHR